MMDNVRDENQSQVASDTVAMLKQKTINEPLVMMNSSTALGRMAEALFLADLSLAMPQPITQLSQDEPLPATSDFEKRAMATLSMPQPWTPDSWRLKPIKQSPAYPEPSKLAPVLKELSHLPPIVHPNEIVALKASLRDVAQGKAFLLQGGDCAELFDYCRHDRIEAKIRLLLHMSVALTHGMNKRVVCIGRMAGQYAKPRSSPMEKYKGEEIPSFRGDILNGFDVDERELDPSRLIKAYQYSSATLNYVRAAMAAGVTDINQNPLNWDLDHVNDPELRQKYTGIVSNIKRTQRFLQAVNSGRPNRVDVFELYSSHEGLVLDYEQALTRKMKKPSSSLGNITNGVAADKEYYDASAHFLWIGDRTRQIDHAHVEFFRGIANPIGIKIGPTTSVPDILSLLRTINPDCEPGKVTLITRYGASKIRALLPSHIRAVEDSEYRRCVVWQCDPMHGNTISTPDGTKTRRFGDIYQELSEALSIHEEQGSYLGGIHLEMTGDAVTECMGGSEDLCEEDLARNYTSFCDPRLNEKQAIELAFLVSSRFEKSQSGMN